MERSEHHMGHQMMEMGPRRMMRRRVGFWWSAFVLGAVVGGIVGMFYAPRRGREMRMAMRANLRRRGVPGRFRRRVSGIMASGRTPPGDLVGQAQRQLEEVRSQAANRVGDVRLRGQILQKRAELRYLQGRQRLRRLR